MRDRWFSFQSNSPPIHRGASVLTLIEAKIIFVPMHIDILTVLPELLESPFQHSIMKRAQEKGLLTVQVHHLRK